MSANSPMPHKEPTKASKDPTDLSLELNDPTGHLFLLAVSLCIRIDQGLPLATLRSYRIRLTLRCFSEASQAEFDTG